MKLQLDRILPCMMMVILVLLALYLPTQKPDKPCPQIENITRDTNDLCITWADGLTWILDINSIPIKEN